MLCNAVGFAVVWSNFRFFIQNIFRASVCFWFRNAKAPAIEIGVDPISRFCFRDPLNCVI